MEPDGSRPAPGPGPTPAGDEPEPRRRRPGELRIGTLVGVDVYVGTSWFFIALIIALSAAPAIEQVEPGLGLGTYVAGLAYAVLLYLSVLLHEMSHAVAARRIGLPVRSISLHFLGGATEMEGEPQRPGHEFFVAVVGPLTSIGIGVVFVALGTVVQDGLLGFAVQGVAWVNLVIGVLNLLPGLPLDGGRVLRAAWWRLRGDSNGSLAVAGWGGRVLGCVCLAWPLVMAELSGRVPTLFDYLIAFVVAGFLWSGGTQAIMRSRARRRVSTLRARDLVRSALGVPEDLPLAEAIRRADASGAGSLVAVDRDGRAAGLVNEKAVEATPEDRRAWMPVSAVSRALTEGLVLPADVEGEDLLRRIARTRASEYLLLEPDGSVLGVLAIGDVEEAFRRTTQPGR